MSKEFLHINDIFKGIDLSKAEQNHIGEIMKRAEYKKGDIIITSGDKVEHMYYVCSGCLRTYHIDKHGREHTVQFGIRDWWITDYTAFFSASKSIMNLEVLQNAILYELSKKDRNYLMEEMPQIHTFIREKLEGAYAAFQKRILANISLTAKERYINFLNTHPEIEQNVKNYHIASYLGITTESLSRIRKELFNS